MSILRILRTLAFGAGLIGCLPSWADDAAPSIWDGFKVGGYSSAGFNVHPGGHTEAGLDEISFLIRWEGDSRIRFFSEVELEKPLSWNSRDKFNNDGSKLDVERLHFDYNLSEKLNIRAGRFLTPAGRWNLIHAAPLVWTATRPLVTSRLFPQYANGVMLYGAKPFDDKAFEYTLFMEAVQDLNWDTDEIKFKDTRGARFAFTGKIGTGLTLLESTEDIPGTPRFRMIGLDFLIKHNDWEFSGEGFQRYYTNQNDGGSGAYLQMVAPLGNQWFLTSRIENFKRPAEGSAERWLIGTAYKIRTNRILKFEYVGGDEERIDSPKGFFTSFAILF